MSVAEPTSDVRPARERSDRGGTDGTEPGASDGTAVPYPSGRDRTAARETLEPPAAAGADADRPDTRVRFLRLARGALVLALGMLALTWLARLAVELAFGPHLDHRFWLRDYVGNLAVALAVLALVRRVGGTLLLAGFVVLGFQLANGAKLAVLGTPTSPDDFINLANLYHLSEGWTRVAMIAILATPFLLLFALGRWRERGTWAGLATIVAVAVLVYAYPRPVRDALDARFGNSVWNQPENFERRGLALHIVQESVRTLAKVGKAPSRAEVETALASLEPAPVDLAALVAGGEGAAPRNVHVIVLESFFDPLSLGSDWVPEDPFPADFRALWAETGESIALSPVFGGYTANAEFEVLCGYPVTENAVFFEGWLRRDVPCLPSVLRAAGYRTVASHPNVAGFWNRTHAYRLTGFDEYLAKSRFDTTDSVGNLLLDHSYYDQVFEQLGPLDEGPPLFNYMLTYHGHLPYPSGENYPDRVQAGRDVPLLQGYLNHLWYKSRDLMKRLETLRAEDPDALIVVFGDHLPFLGPNYGVHDEVLGLPPDRKDFSGAQLEALVSTPLIVIDGERGPLELGRVPLYRLPALVLGLLGAESGGMLDWTENPPGTIVRPVYGMHVAVGEDGARACPPEAAEDEGCAESAAWLARTRTLIGDVFTGSQFALERLGTLPRDAVPTVEPVRSDPS